MTRFSNEFQTGKSHLHPTIRFLGCHKFSPVWKSQLASKKDIPSRELTYPPDKAYLKMIFLFPRWDMLISWRVPRKMATTQHRSSSGKLILKEAPENLGFF